jgi:hypothetical protein
MLITICTILSNSLLTRNIASSESLVREHMVLYGELCGRVSIFANANDFMKSDCEKFGMLIATDTQSRSVACY